MFENGERRRQQRRTPEDGYTISSPMSLRLRRVKKFCPKVILNRESPLSGNTLRVSYHLCIRHTLGTVFELHQSSENALRYFYIIKTKKYV